MAKLAGLDSPSFVRQQGEHHGRHPADDDARSTAGQRGDDADQRPNLMPLRIPSGVTSRDMITCVVDYVMHPVALLPTTGD